jgi:hypothetical protein
MVLKVRKVPLELKEQQEKQDLKVNTESKVPLDPKEQLEKVAHLAP